MINHEKLCELCSLLDDPQKGLKDDGQREKVLAITMYKLYNGTIEFYKKTVYGNERGYILDPKLAHAVYCISGKTTLCNVTMKGLEMLGFTFKEVLPPKK